MRKQEFAEKEEAPGLLEPPLGERAKTPRDSQLSELSPLSGVFGVCFFFFLGESWECSSLFWGGAFAFSLF